MLDFKDIQGNILLGYRSFWKARFLYFKFKTGPEGAKLGRNFLTALLDQRLITPADWGKNKPDAATNVAISMAGLRALQLNSETLASFPGDFQEGMRARADDLGDIGESHPEKWDQPWRSNDVHLLLMCYSGEPNILNSRCKDLEDLAAGMLDQLQPSQDAGKLVIGKQAVPSPKEHFGFDDGLSNPDVENARDGTSDADVGNLDSKGNFREVPVGEFLLGHRGEGGEVAPMPKPPLLVHNGTFLVMRKLQQEVVRFRQYLKEEAERMMKVPGCLPDKVAGDVCKVQEYLAAKMMGRWKDGSPVDLYPDAPAGHQTNAFSYHGDEDGARCPLGAHVRRANPRDSLGFAGQIVNRRRMLRRGITYGEFLPEDASPTSQEAQAERGIMFLSLNASIERQFEFIQKQWMMFGEEFKQGDDGDPITGTRFGDGHMVGAVGPKRGACDAKGRMVIQGDQRTGRIPYVCSQLPNFVITKGGEYFFMPSMTGLVLLASGKVSTK
jgi:Dyp-type peroxidase family